jgi:hypothetical protein
MAVQCKRSATISKYIMPIYRIEAELQNFREQLYVGMCRIASKIWEWVIALMRMQNVSTLYQDSITTGTEIDSAKWTLRKQIN